MSWVNLNDVYVNKTGDTITGDLAVNGALTANGNLTVKKDSTTYNVADEISTLRDSVSKIVAGSVVVSLFSVDNNHSTATLPASSLKTLIGTSWDQKMVMVCSNGDTAAQNNIYSITCAWNNSEKKMHIMCYTSTASSGNFRLNYICYLNKKEYKI